MCEVAIVLVVVSHPYQDQHEVVGGYRSDVDNKFSDGGYGKEEFIGKGSENEDYWGSYYQDAL